VEIPDCSGVKPPAGRASKAVANGDTPPSVVSSHQKAECEPLLGLSKSPASPERLPSVKRRVSKGSRATSPQKVEGRNPYYLAILSVAIFGARCMEQRAEILSL